ncbi:hypothetical protein C8R44DRAFT_891267 [Mycena epipterygia]|nr:hypothetical protein C8R44DRAFT_891267 [Mycena epipterygia]
MGECHSGVGFSTARTSIHVLSIATSALVEALVDTLLGLDSRSPHGAASLIARANASGRSLVCGLRMEQRAILQHPDLGWFLIHGDFNSEGIPLIVWPTNAEQPVNAALLSSGSHPVVIELLQVHSHSIFTVHHIMTLAPGPHRPTNRAFAITGAVEDASAEFAEVFKAAPGARGAILRINTVKMAVALRAARAGEAGDELKRLAAF